MEHREILGNFSWRALQTAGKEGVLFLIFFIAAKLLIPFDFGIYSYVLAVMFFIVLFGNFGISTATSRYVAEYNTSDKEKVKPLLFNSALLILLSSSVVILLVVLFGEPFLKEHYTFILYALPLVVLAPMAALYDGVYRGLKKFKTLAIISITTGAVSAGFAHFLISNYGLVGALMAQNLLYLLLFAGLFIKHRDIAFTFDTKLIQTIASYSFVVGVSGLGYYLYTRMDIIILERFGYITELGYYEIINQFFNLLIFPVIILGQVVSPDVAALNAQKSYSLILKKLRKYFLLIVPGGVGLTVLFYFAFPSILRYFLKEYDTPTMIYAFSILILLLPLKLWGVFQTQAFFVSSGFVKVTAITTLIGGVLNIILDILFIRWFGFVGVFWATLIIHSLNISFVSCYYWLNLRKGYVL